ncbi:Pentatricopeptide repeat, partial [Quillaja saponaria]
PVSYMGSLLLIERPKFKTESTNMPYKFQMLSTFSRENNHGKFKSAFDIKPSNHLSPYPISYNLLNVKSITSDAFIKKSQLCFRLLHSIAESEKPIKLQQDPFGQSATSVQNLLKHRRDKSVEEIERALDLCGFVLNDDFVLNVLRRHRADWRPAYIFFNWASRESVGGHGYIPGSDVYNEVLDILGTMKRFKEWSQVLDEMSKRKGLVNEVTYGVLLNRYAAAHKVNEAIDIFYKREEFGLELDYLVAFQTLLMWLCRYKHVEVAETLFHAELNEFHHDIKTWNIILNGWCVLGNVYEAKRLWKDILASKCKPDVFTYGTFINALTKKGKLGTALKLFRAMWDKGCKPDVVICNCIIDALCFKKRIPESLNVFQEMKERGLYPNVATYNSLIKHLCKIQRMEKVYELLDEMEQRKGSCSPNAITYIYLLKSVKEPEEVPQILEKMERNKCSLTGDTYNLILRLYMDCDYPDRVRDTWESMERNGLGPDRRSYTIMIHGNYYKGRIKDALRYLREMTSKGMIPEPRTEILVDAMGVRLKERAGKHEGSKEETTNL